MCRRCLTFLLLHGLLVLSIFGHAQTTPAVKPTVLKTGKPITQSLQSGQAYDYAVALKAGEALKATVQQKGVDVVVTAYGPDGTKIAAFDSPTSTEYQEFVTVVAPTAGRYRLAVTPFDPKAQAGTFVMTLTGILTPAQYAQSQTEDGKRANATAAYLQAPHPDKTSYEQRDELLKLNPAALMPMANLPEIAAAHWLEGTWAATMKRFANLNTTEITFPASTSVLRFSPTSATMLQIDWQANGKFVPFMVFDAMSRQWVRAYISGDETGTNWGLLKGHDWQNNQLMLEGETGDLGLVSHTRQTWAKTDDHTLRVLEEERKADGSWLPVSEMTLTKTTPTDITAK